MGDAVYYYPVMFSFTLCSSFSKKKLFLSSVRLRFCGDHAKIVKGEAFLGNAVLLHCYVFSTPDRGPTVDNGRWSVDMLWAPQKASHGPVPPSGFQLRRDGTKLQAFKPRFDKRP